MIKNEQDILHFHYLCRKMDACFVSRLPKFKAEVRSIGKAVIPSIMSKYFSSIKESSQCSKVCFNQVSSKTPDTFDTTQDSSNSPYNRHSTKKGHPSSTKSLDPPNLVRLESISTTLTTSQSRPSKLFFRTKKHRKRRSERYRIKIIYNI